MVTPRTDAVMLDPLRDGNDLPALASQLETELAAMTDSLAVIAYNMTFVAYQPAVVREALAAYENHKKGNTP